MESKLRQAVKQAASEYYRHVHGTKKELTYIPPSGKVLDEEDLMFKIWQRFLNRKTTKKQERLWMDAGCTCAA